MPKHRTCLAAVLLLIAASPVQADELCNLQRIAVLDAKVEDSIHLMVPARFGNTRTRLMLDTGGGWSVMRESFARELGLRPKRLRTSYFVDVAGGRTTHYVTAPRVTLDNQLLLGASDFILDPEDGAQSLYGGTVGAEQLTKYDVEIDNARKTVTLFRPDKSCSGRLVRWSDSWAEIPYSFKNEILETDVVVGNETIHATFDTGSPRSLMDFDVARRLFGVGPGSKGVRKGPRITMPSGAPLQFYNYRVKSLTLSALTFTNVDVYLGDYDDTPLLIGMPEIAQLHLYIAPQRRMIYATRIGAK